MHTHSEDPLFHGVGLHSTQELSQHLREVPHRVASETLEYLGLKHVRVHKSVCPFANALSPVVRIAQQLCLLSSFDQRTCTWTLSPKLPNSINRMSHKNISKHLLKSRPTEGNACGIKAEHEGLCDFPDVWEGSFRKRPGGSTQLKF